MEVEHIETRQEPLDEHHAGDPDRVHDDPHECDQYHQEADVYYKMGASVNFMLESFCCKKSPNQEIGLRRFSEYQTSEGSE